jgi:WW domain-containing oxidoreductase
VAGLLEQHKDNGRVVMLSSEGHRQAPAGGIEFDNLSGDKGYKPLAAYGQSKVADLLFAKNCSGASPAPRRPPARCTPSL